MYTGEFAPHFRREREERLRRAHHGRRRRRHAVDDLRDGWHTRGER